MPEVTQLVILLIGGQNQPAASGATFERRNPVNDTATLRTAVATLGDVDTVIQAVADVFPVWTALLPGGHYRYPLEAADLTSQHTDAFVRAGAAETGASPNWIGFSVMLVADMLHEAASMTAQIDDSVIPSDVPDNLTMAMCQPCGVVLGIAPWNAPVILGMCALAMSLVRGSMVVLKTSELCPGVHRLIGTVLQETGLGDDMVNVVTDAPADATQVVEHLIAHPAVCRADFMSFTYVGRIITQHVIQYLKPALLELGGKASMLVLDDVNLNTTADAIMSDVFFN